MQQTFKQLKRNSFKIEKGMVAYWSTLDKTQELDPNSYIAPIKGQKAFAVTDKILSFICEGEMYITPNTRENLCTLRNNGYKEYSFFVPLSPQGMTLVDEKLAQKWQAIVDKAHPSSGQQDDLEIRWGSQAAVATA